MFQVGARKIAFRNIAQIIRIFWELGKWSLLTVLISILATESFLWTLAFFHGSGEVGKWQAVLNMLGLTHPILIGLSNLMIPAVAQARAGGGFSAAKQTALQLGSKGGLLLAPYFVLLLIYPAGVLRLFYGADSPYLSLEVTVRVMAVCYFVMYLSIILGGFLRGLKESKLVFVIQMVGTVAAVVVGLPMAALFGVNGAAFGNAVTVSAKVGANVFFFRGVERRELSVPS
jgi:O-antigen/teichoic acid export membrane protein